MLMFLYFCFTKKKNNLAMKKNYIKSLTTYALILLCFFTYAQQVRLASPERYEIDWDVCIYTPTEEAALINNARSQFVKDRMENRETPCSNFVVTYGSGFNAFPDAQAAFQFAVDIWSNLISTPIDIRVTASFDPAAPGNLGSAGSDGFFKLTGDGIPEDTLYPAALTELLINGDVDGPTGVSNDINANFNSNRTDWYFGTDANTPAGQFDFVSVVLHELGHGLGVLGFGRENGNNGEIRFTSSNDGSRNASIWDNFIDGLSIFQAPLPILNEVEFPDPGPALLVQFEGNNLTINSPLAVAQNGGVSPKTYAPSTFNGGSSYSHLDEDTFNNTPHALMTPFSARAEANHDPGNIILGFMEDMGWILCQGSLSTNDFALDDLKVSPNPFTNTITIELPPQIANQEFDISMVDINGRIVLNTNSTVVNGEITISNLSNLKNAFYFLNIKSKSSDLSITKKIIKQ